MRIGLIDVGGKMPNVALMKLSAFHKQHGDSVVLNDFSARDVDRIYVSVLFSRDRRQVDNLRAMYRDVEMIVGGPGWDLHTVLPDEVEAMPADFDLYTVDGLYNRMRGVKSRESRLARAEQVVNAGIGFVNRGCPRTCSFCVVPAKEGKLRRVANLSDILNPRSNRLILLDNNVTADPDALALFAEMRDRNLEVNISQGIDVRLLTPELADALSQLRLINSTIHYAWDLPDFESHVLSGIERLSQRINPWRHICYMLVGFNTSFEQDLLRYRKLWEGRRVHPYVMLYRGDGAGPVDRRLQHFARWVNARVHKVLPNFEDYGPWVRDRDAYFSALQGSFF